jgi:hypothetical protein
MEYNITSTIKAIASGAYGQYIFANNPNVSLSDDSTARIRNYGAASLKITDNRALRNLQPLLASSTAILSFGGLEPTSTILATTILTLHPS